MGEPAWKCGQFEVTGPSRGRQKAAVAAALTGGSLRYLVLVMVCLELFHVHLHLSSSTPVALFFGVGVWNECVVVCIF